MQAHASDHVITPAPCKGMQRDETARKNTTAILKAARSVGQMNIAEYAGVTESMASRWCAENVDALGKAIAAMGYKLVPIHAKCVKDQQTLDSLLHWARIGMNSLRSAEDLFEDPE